MQHLALVTGANRGLGLEVSRQLGQRGYRVLMAARDPEKGQAAAEVLKREGLTAEAVPLDVGDLASAQTLASDLSARFDALDVLVNNAGVHYDTWNSGTAPDWTVVDEAWRTNTLGAWHVASCLSLLLRASKHGRLVNVSSGAGELHSMTHSTPAYSVTKAALNALTRVLASELRDDGVLVNAVCPGWTATDMGGGGRPVEEGARGIVWAATLPEDGPTGGFFRDERRLDW
ncbi:MAG: SDR family oxidoreductase [Planctomycetota bacterium]|jgi:NAD(P)-dependent dehydrogenase (short-subunit alcohol dehydrogenase family)